jgi:hypothetical protein
MKYYNECCEEEMKKYDKQSAVSTAICPVCGNCLKPWWYINKKNETKT